MMLFNIQNPDNLDFDDLEKEISNLLPKHCENHKLILNDNKLVLEIVFRPFPIEPYINRVSKESIIEALGVYGKAT